MRYSLIFRLSHFVVESKKDYSTTNGIFNAGHAVQDSYAGGHRNFAEYHGMVRSVIMRPDHFLRDANISMSTYRGIVGVTRNMIDQYNRNAPSMMLNLRVRLH